MSADEFAFLSLGDLATALGRRRVSSVELTEYFLDRLATHGVALNAVASLMPERGLKEAANADRRRRRGDAGALLGIPYGAKDLLAARGAPTTFGSPAFRDQWLDFDAAPIEALQRAGSPLAAKLALSELGSTATRDPRASLHGPPRNPWNQDWYPGGSSTGPGICVAAGLLPFALGSETGGSIAAPAALSGITGIRPTYGLVSRFGAMPASWSMDKVGVLARSAADCGLVLEVIGRGDRRDPGSANRRYRPHPSLPDLGSIRAGIAWSDVDHADEGLRPALREGMDALQSLGARFVEIELPQEHDYWKTIVTIMDGDAASAFGPFIEGPRLKLLTTADQRNGMRKLLRTRARDYVDAQRVRRKIQVAMREIFRSVDILVSCTLPIDASVIPLDRVIVDIDMHGGNTALIAAGNLAGLPGVFLPVGLSAARVPVGIQLVGPPHSDALLVAIGTAFQRQTPWHMLRPGLANLEPAAH